MSVRAITTLAEFKPLVAASKLTVCDFTASWCGPCRHIAPIFAQLATQKPKVQFLKIDVDEAQEIAQQVQVRAMPTFAFYINGNMVEKFEGADPNRLQQLIEKYETQATPTPTAIPSDEELKKLSAKQLLSLMAEHSISSQGLPEKDDLIQALSKNRK